MSLLKLRNKPKRNGFDLSRKNAFTAKAGELLPVFHEHVLPGDNFRINLQSFTRTQPLQTAAFTRLREYYDFYFVPYRLLWRYAPQFFAMTSENQFAESVTGTQYFPSLLPHVTIEQLAGACYELKSSYNEFEYSVGDLATKLCNYLDLGLYDLDQSISLAGKSLNVNLLSLAAYQKIIFVIHNGSRIALCVITSITLMVMVLLTLLSCTLVMSLITSLLFVIVIILLIISKVFCRLRNMVIQL